MRGDTPIGFDLPVAAVVLIAVAGAALLVEVHRRGRLGRLGLAGIGACALGVALLLIGVVLMTTVYGPDFSAMPAFVVPGVVLVSVGLVLVAVVVLRSGVLPRWAGLALVIGAVLLLLVNEQTARVLFAVPLGLAWVLAGVAMLRERSDGAAVKVRAARAR